MAEALVATFKDVRTIIDKEHRKIRVMVPDATRAEVLEILKRHEPAEVH